MWLHGRDDEHQRVYEHHFIFQRGAVITKGRSYMEMAALDWNRLIDWHDRITGGVIDEFPAQESRSQNVIPKDGHEAE